MSSVFLLDKTRKIGNLLHNNSQAKVIFDDICAVMLEIMDSDAYVLSKKGKVLGVATKGQDIFDPGMLSKETGSFADKNLNERFLSILSTKENCNLLTLGFEGRGLSDYKGMVTPIYVAGKRYGTVFLIKNTEEYDIDDIILSEYCSTVVGLEMMRAATDELEEDERKLVSVQAALDVMTETEKKAALFLFNEMPEGNALIVTSQIADRAGITRSVLVNAIKKLESAGIVNAVSAGMRGTRLSILNDCIISELEKSIHN